MRDAFEQACYQHYLEQHKAGKHGNDTPMALKSLMWRQENGQYGVLAFNSAWWGWGSARTHVAGDLSLAMGSPAVPAVPGPLTACTIATALARLAQDAELRAAISELRTALGNPVISGAGMQTVASQTVRAAVDRVKEMRTVIAYAFAHSDQAEVFLADWLNGEDMVGWPDFKVPA